MPNFILVSSNSDKKTYVRNVQYWSVLVDRAGRSKNGHRHFKLMLCCFCPIISPHTKFHPNWMKNTKVENFHFRSMSVGRAGGSKNGRNHFKHSESVQFKGLLMTFVPNLKQIGRKLAKLAHCEIFFQK